MPNNSRKEIALWGVSVLYSGEPTSSLGRWMEMLKLCLVSKVRAAMLLDGTPACSTLCVCYFFLAK